MVDQSVNNPVVVESLANLYRDLQLHAEQNNHEQVIKDASNIMQQASEAQQEYPMASKAYLTALIKTKQFEKAVEYIKSKANKGKDFNLQQAYILHRQGKNKEAAQIISKIKNIDEGVQHLKAQVNYKLGDYKSSIDIYEKSIKEGASELAADEVCDILTNLVACGSTDSGQINHVKSIVTTAEPFQKTYEYYFNESQLFMREQMYEHALQSMQKSYELAKEDGSEQTDATRFKVQEIHTLNNFYNAFNLIEYNSDAKLNMARQLKNSVLVELNVSAIQETYSQLDKQQFKDLIGNLNWTKFSDRIEQQLDSDTNFTIEQKQLLQINSIVALIRSNQLDKAKKNYKMMLKNNNQNNALQGIGAYFHIKQKNYADALQLVKEPQDNFSFFLKSHVLFCMKQPQQALENLVKGVDQHINDNNVQDSYLMFLLQTCDREKCLSSEFLTKVYQYAFKNVTEHVDLLILVSEMMIHQKNMSKALELLRKLNELNPENQFIQSRYLSLAADLDFKSALGFQQKLSQPDIEQMKSQNMSIQQLIDDAMPEKVKEKKTHGPTEKQTEGGAQIYIPKKRKRKILLPKGFDPAMPPPMPDPERWLPKWQRSRYKKMAKKKGVYIKGAQGDALVNTDVTKMASQQTQQHEVSTAGSKNKGNKRRRR